MSPSPAPATLLLALALAAACTTGRSPTGPAAAAPAARTCAPASPRSESAAPGCSAPPQGIADEALHATLRRGAIDPAALRCNTRVEWETSLARYAGQLVDELVRFWSIPPERVARSRAKHLALGYLVRSYFEQTQRHNLGAMAVKGRTHTDAQGRVRPLLIFRSGIVVTSDGPSPCYQSLLEHGGVQHVFNLYSGTFPFRDLIQAEAALARQRGATYLDAAELPEGNWRQLVEHPADYSRNLQRAMQQAAALIGSILRPGGKPPRGNLYFHCGGGMHRSGMIFGLIRRCINGDPLALIEEEYKRHTGWLSPERPGGFEALNLRFIRDFDCALLETR